MSPPGPLMLLSIALLLFLSSKVDVEVAGFVPNVLSNKLLGDARLHPSDSGLRNDKYSSMIFGSKDEVPIGIEQCPTVLVAEDPYIAFPLFDKLLFFLFARSVTAEMGKNSALAPKNYGELMSLINEMTKTRSIQRVNDQGKNMLKRLFPPWLLTQYKWMFAAPFPEFSAWMNAYVTHWTTNWLMGDSKIYDLEFTDSFGKTVVRKQQGLLVEKCRFLESAGCARTCLHACKIPTQRFFLEEMGLPVTLSPNMTDFSCKFEFGVMPLLLEDDPISKTPCLSGCPLNLKKEECLSSLPSK